MFEGFGRILEGLGLNSLILLLQGFGRILEGLGLNSFIFCGFGKDFGRLKSLILLWFWTGFVRVETEVFDFLGLWKDFEGVRLKSLIFSGFGKNFGRLGVLHCVLVLEGFGS